MMFIQFFRFSAFIIIVIKSILLVIVNYYALFKMIFYETVYWQCTVCEITFEKWVGTLSGYDKLLHGH